MEGKVRQIRPTSLARVSGPIQMNQLVVLQSLGMEHLSFVPRVRKALIPKIDTETIDNLITTVGIPDHFKDAFTANVVLVKRYLTGSIIKDSFTAHTTDQTQDNNRRSWRVKHQDSDQEVLFREAYLDINQLRVNNINSVTVALELLTLLYGTIPAELRAEDGSRVLEHISKRVLVQAKAFGKSTIEEKEEFVKSLNDGIIEFLGTFFRGAGSLIETEKIDIT